jgi:DNA-binding transcriptional regulator YdaS (Cro superfamily)
MTTVAEIIEAMGGVAAAARKLGVAHPSVIKWRNGGRVPAERVPAVSEASGIARHVIRPDLYQAPASAAEAG